MSTTGGHIQNLISELCPNGVEFPELGAVCEIGKVGADKKSIEGQQRVLLLNYMDVVNNRRISKSSLKMEVTATNAQFECCNIKRGDVFITPTSETKEDIGISAVAVETIPDAVYSYHVMRIRPNVSDFITSCYIGYLFESDGLQKQIQKAAMGITRFGLTKGKFSRLRIPVPPLPIQAEIVKTLDTFIKLEAELEARKKQYEYYRDRLLTFKPIP